MHEGFQAAGAVPAMVLALCFALGLNPFGCLFALGVMARMQMVALPVGLGAVGSWWFLGVCGALAFGEFVLDKVPGLDVIWNVLQTLVRVPVAGVVAFAAAGEFPVAGRVVLAVVGMGFAGVAHGAMVAMRVSAVSRPKLLANVLLSLGEDGVALGLVWLALREPRVAGVCAVGLAGLALGLGCCGLGMIRRGLAGRFGDRRVRAGSEADRGCGIEVSRPEDGYALLRSTRVAGR